MQARHRHRHFVGLAAVAHAGVPHGLQTLARDLLLHQVLQRVRFHRGEDRVELGGCRPVDRRDAGQAALLVHVGHQHAVGAEGAGIARNENAADAELGGDQAGDGRAHAAERHQRELARIVAALRP